MPEFLSFFCQIRVQNRRLNLKRPNFVTFILKIQQKMIKLYEIKTFFVRIPKTTKKDEKWHKIQLP